MIDRRVRLALLAVLSLLAAPFPAQAQEDLAPEAASAGDETDPASAQPGDADADSTEKVTGGVAANARRKLQKQQGKVAAAKPKVPPGETKWGKLADAFVRAHIEHTNGGDLDAYLGDFVPDLRNSEEHRAYSERVLGILRPQVEIVALEVAVVKHKASHVHVVQRTTYVDEWGRDREDVALIKYNLREMGGAWYIASTSRSWIPELPDDSIF